MHKRVWDGSHCKKYDITMASCATWLYIGAKDRNFLRALLVQGGLQSDVLGLDDAQLQLFLPTF